MRYIFILILLFISACSGGRFSTPQAEGYAAPSPVQCVPFAREQSGIQIFGNAGTWWDKAPPRYSRGTEPKPGAVLVLKATQKMPHGHLAVVKRVLYRRKIDVAHSNWGSDRATRSMVYERMRVEDISDKNDWSAVRFWNNQFGSFGFPYAAYGFIYQ